MKLSKRRQMNAALVLRARPDCALCGGTGWKEVYLRYKPDHGQPRMAPCECRKLPPAPVVEVKPETIRCSADREDGDGGDA